MKTKPSIGVLSLQGDIEEHKYVTQHALDRAGSRGDVISIRYAEEIERIDGLILPGGESTVVGTLIGIQGGIFQTIRRRISQGMPVLGTCAGMILLAKRAYDRVLGDTKQQLLSNLDIVVERNAFGRQSDSFEADLSIPTLGKSNGTFKGVFIRAPVVTELGAGIDIFAEFNNRIVGVRQGNIIGTSFHPELSDDDRIHRHFVRTVLEWNKRERVETKTKTEANL